MGLSLEVRTGELSAIGTSLKSSSEQLATAMTNLESQMSGITEGWKDSEGAAFSSKFQAFITEAKSINSDLESLGKLVETVATKYYNTVKSYAAQME